MISALKYIDALDLLQNAGADSDAFIFRDEWNNNEWSVPIVTLNYDGSLWLQDLNGVPKPYKVSATDKEANDWCFDDE